MISALIPVKQLRAAKSRLLPDLPSDVLERLTIAMLEDVIEAVQATPGIETVAVVTPDHDVASATIRAGARALLRNDDGLNPSLEAAAGILVAEGATGLLILLGDVPSASPAGLKEIVQALEDSGGAGVVLAASRDGGTAALLRSPPNIVPVAFGKDSAARHRQLALEANVAYREVTPQGLSIDLDVSQDVDDFLRGKGGPRTRALLTEIRWGGSR